MYFSALAGMAVLIFLPEGFVLRPFEERSPGISALQTI